MSPTSNSRIADRFRELRERGAKGLVVYLTAGDPTLEDTGRLVAALDRAGADVIELGVPFS
ncbi:MAG TPA: tryptophan synthase subunit alpha, partial [Terriglobia bacterium]|nr:tryptophan synthase subunit alpha [Terriglobia bacterium]